MKRGLDLPLEEWPAFDFRALPETLRVACAARKTALELYGQGATLSDVERRTGVHRRQLYRLLTRCQSLGDDGCIVGWRGLVPYKHVGHYERSAGVRRDVHGDCVGAAGAFRQLLVAHPELEDWIEQGIRRKRTSIHQLSTDGGLRLRIGGLKALHEDFLRQCRLLGLGPGDYPFNTDQLGIRSLSATIRARVLASFGRGARLAGAARLKGLAGETSAPAALNYLDVVEFDGHRLDLRLKILVRDPLGFEQEFEIERIWLLVIIDVWTRAVLGYHLCLNREYTRYDVIRTIEAALEPHRPRTYTLPGLHDGHGGFPSSTWPELGYATWQWIKLDNARANLCEDVRHALAEFVGCHIDAGPPHAPDDRPYIERFFGTVASTMSSRLPGYTGSSPRDLRRGLADAKGGLRMYLTLGELEQIVEATLAGYNGTVHAGLNGRTPLEAVAYSVHVRGAMLNVLPEPRRRTLCLMQTPRRATVRGYLHQGQRPHINFHGVRYTNAVLAGTGSFLGRELRIYYNSQDLRTVRAFTADGAELGLLKAQGAWGEFAHDIKLRQEILRQRGRKRLAGVLSPEFLQRLVEQKVSRARHSRRAASELAQVLKVLAAAPTSVSASDHAAAVEEGVPRPAPAPAPAPALDSPGHERQRIEPRTLTIGTGYAGS